MKLTMDEIFEILPVDQDEVEIPRTNDLGNITNPNWDGPMKQFSLGLQNSHETVLSNMIGKKVNNEVGNLSMFLDFIKSSQMQIFEFMLNIMDKILNKERK